MRQFGRNLLRFVAFGIGALIAFGFAAQTHPKLESLLFAKPGSYGYTYRRIPEFIEQARIEPIDAVILGSSTCYRGIDPYHFAKLDFRSFNLCSSSQSLFNSKHLLQWSLQEVANPSAILVDVYPKMWTSSGIESCRDLTVNHDHALQVPFLRMAAETWDPFNFILALYSGIARKFRPLSFPEETDLYKTGGFTYSIRAPVDTLDCTSEVVTMSTRQARAFERIRRTCEEEGIRLLLVNPPQLCEEVFEKPEVMAGLPWIEGNDWPLAKVDTLYYDDHHLRGVGAELYSAWLAEQVVALME
jgi:hypothetical protein